MDFPKSAQKYSKTPSQIILKFTLSRGVGVVPKTKTVERLKENFDSWSFELSE
jgi:diketogulonate reductase-like aldo/keto reductase